MARRLSGGSLALLGYIFLVVSVIYAVGVITAQQTDALQHARAERADARTKMDVARDAKLYRRLDQIEAEIKGSH